MTKFVEVTCTLPGPASDADSAGVEMILSTALHGRLGDTSTVRWYRHSFSPVPEIEPWVRSQTLLCRIEFEPVHPDDFLVLSRQVEQMFANLGFAPGDYCSRWKTP